ncbi:MAG: response regulator [Burkholderiaceae bacterium]|nr:response regulator [Burkholderiaceae bacterium]
MNDYLLWGAGAVLVLLVALLLVRRRSAPALRRDQSKNRQQPSDAVTRAADAVPSRSRGASQFDTANAVHEMELAPRAGVDVPLEADREAAQAAELAARAEADREAAEWEARLVAQLLADQERERAAIEAERLAAEAAANEPPPPDERAVREQADREAAEWEAKLVAQRLADEEIRRVEAERLAAETAAAEQLQRDIAAHVALERAAQDRFERAADEQLARLEAQRMAEAAQAEAEAARIAAAALAAASAEAAFTTSLEPAAAVLAVAAGPRTPEQCLVMIADDSKVVRVKTSRLLAKHLYRVSLAEDGLDAARQIEIDLPHVLITDVEMPGMDGFELTRQVRSNPRTAHIPIVMITADDEKHRADALEAGVSVLLSKPYPEDQLLSYLQSTLSGAAAH